MLRAIYRARYAREGEKMKKLMLLGLAVLVGAVVLTTGCTSYGPSSPSSAPQTSTASQNTVSMKNIAFNPSSLTISKGASVTWTNDDSTTHTTTSDTGLWDSGNLSPGQSYTRQFNDTGTFPYHCSIHVGQGMKGTIIVATGSSTASPSAAVSASPTASSTPTATASPSASQQNAPIY